MASDYGVDYGEDWNRARWKTLNFCSAKVAATAVSRLHYPFILSYSG